MRHLYILGIVIFTFLSIPAFAAATGGTDPQEFTKTPDGISGADWQAIREAHEAQQRRAIPTENGYLFRHSSQNWSTRLDGRRFVVSPDSGGWTAGLQLESYGNAKAPIAITGNAAPASSGEAVSFPWNAQLTEWYKNTPAGLEHGYTVHGRPAGVDGLLTLNLGVVDSLRPSVDASGRDIRFFDAGGHHVLSYAGLKVYDSTGAELAAHFEFNGARLMLQVEEHAAQYPLTIDPIVQQAYIKASNTGSNDQFGYSLAVSGNTVAVGAFGEASNATGVNGNQTNNSAAASGAVYVFVRNAGVWSQQAYLKASNTGTNDQFGFSVSLSGDTLVVGALGEDSNATGVNGNQADNSALDSGAVYVFVRSGGTWSQQAYLKASNTNSLDGLGYSVAISGDTLVAGAIGEGSNATGVNGNQLDNSLTNAGAAYVFTRSGTTWSQQAYLKASNTDGFDQFGYAVAFSNDTVVVGAYLEDSNATGVNGDGSNNSAGDAGAAYVFLRSAGTWTQQAYLKASNTNAGDTFGNAVAVSGDTIAIGANFEDSSSTGVNGVQTDNSFVNAGAVYVFVRSAGVWTQQAYLKASNTDAGDLFGYSVSLSVDRLAVGAFGEASNATGFNGNQASNTSLNAGAVYLFTRSGTVWSQQTYIKASNTDAGDFFGVSVGLSGDLLAVGAPLEDSNATGINGHQNINSVSSSGAVYAFDLNSSLGLVSYGTGTPGCAGTHTLGANHVPLINSPNFAITCDNAPPFSLGLGMITDSQDLAGSDPFGLGVLLHCDFVFATEVLTVDFNSNGTGYSESVSAVIPNSNALIGKTYYTCVLWAWPLATCTLPGFNPYNLSTSRGLAITIQQP